MAQQTQFDLPQANLRQLMNMTPRPYYGRKGSCRVVSQQYGAGSRLGFQRSRPKHPIYYNELRAAITCPSKQRRYSYIRFYGPPDPKSPAWVWCSCQDFGYRLKWVLSKIRCSTLATGYSGQGVQIINEPPDIKNPQKKPGLCKHLLLAAELALRQTKDYASEQGAQKEASARPRRVSVRPKRVSVNTEMEGQITTFDD